MCLKLLCYCQLGLDVAPHCQLGLDVGTHCQLGLDVGGMLRILRGSPWLGDLRFWWLAACASVVFGATAIKSPAVAGLVLVLASSSSLLW